jgi:hypothetical protein
MVYPEEEPTLWSWWPFFDGQPHSSLPTMAVQTRVSVRTVVNGTGFWRVWRWGRNIRHEK